MEIKTVCRPLVFFSMFLKNPAKASFFYIKCVQCAGPSGIPVEVCLLSLTGRDSLCSLVLLRSHPVTLTVVSPSTGDPVAFGEVRTCPHDPVPLVR